MSKTAKSDRIWLGATLGAAVPLIAFYLYYTVKFGDVKFSYYISSLHEYKMLFKMMSLCVLADLPLFYLFLQLKWLRAARGVVMACFVFAFFVLGYRIFN
jgi:hypothetical protein